MNAEFIPHVRAAERITRTDLSHTWAASWSESAARETLIVGTLELARAAPIPLAVIEQIAVAVEAVDDVVGQAPLALDDGIEAGVEGTGISRAASTR